LAAFQIDEGSGALSLLHTYDVGQSLTWVLAVKLGNEWQVAGTKPV